MPDRGVYLLVVDGFADWEPAHALAELRRTGGYRVELVGCTPESVQSMGGLRVQPTVTIDSVDTADVALFVIPGGECWEHEPPAANLVTLLRALDGNGVPIAAICAATVAITRAGLLRGRRHTSNGLAYLQQQVPGYTEAHSYIDAPAVRDRGLITASGASDVEFAREIFAELNVFSEADRALWTDIFRSGRLPSGAA
jgi:putative intracellular protease/amidase